MTEVDRLRTFHDDIVKAWRTANATRKHPPAPFIVGQKLRRLVRQAIERFDSDDGGPSDE